MRKTLFAGLAFAALTTSAFAADMPAYAPEPAVAPAFSWTGAYIGAHGGWGFGEFDDGFETLDDVDGFVIGGQIGYNWQWDSFVLGLEGDASFSDQQNDDFIDVTVENDFLASIRGRLGFAAGRFLIYGTGGAAFAGASLDTPDGSDDADYFGWVAGGGIEYAITDNITFGVEYLHYEFDDETITVGGVDLFDADFSNDVVRGRLNVKFDSLFN